MRLTTKQHSKYWKNRKINWKEHYTATWNHPHRDFLCKVLKTFKWVSLIEVGCASAPNLIKIAQEFPRVDLGGVDINADAIEEAQKMFKNRMFFKVGRGDNIMISDKSTDVILTDMTLIYVGPTEIMNYLREFYRVSRNYIVLHELYSPHWYERLWLRIKAGYHAYDYKKLLQKAGFYDITRYKVPTKCFPGADPIQRKYNYILVARK